MEWYHWKSPWLSAIAPPILSLSLSSSPRVFKSLPPSWDGKRRREEAGGRKHNLGTRKRAPYSTYWGNRPFGLFSGFGRADIESSVSTGHIEKLTGKKAKKKIQRDFSSVLFSLLLMGRSKISSNSGWVHAPPCFSTELVQFPHHH